MSVINDILNAITNELRQYNTFPMIQSILSEIHNHYFSYIIMFYGLIISIFCIQLVTLFVIIYK